jgi:hypothetical protein
VAECGRGVEQLAFAVPGRQDADRCGPAGHVDRRADLGRYRALPVHPELAELEPQLDAGQAGRCAGRGVDGVRRGHEPILGGDEIFPRRKAGGTGRRRRPRRRAGDRPERE